MTLKIEILGAECSTCSKLLDRVQKITHDNRLDASIEKITDTQRIMAYGIYSIPALVINGKVVSKGIAPSENEIIILLNNFLSENEKIPIPIGSKLTKSIGVAIFIPIIIIIIISLILAFMFFYQEKKTNQSKIQSDKGLIKTISIADSINLLYNYSQQNTKYKITFLEFGSTGCAPCKKMEKVMDTVRNKYKTSVNVVFYNVRKKENKKMIDHFGIQIIPVQIFLDKNGKECFRHLGYYSFNELNNEFRKQGINEGNKNNFILQKYK